MALDIRSARREGLVKRQKCTIETMLFNSMQTDLLLPTNNHEVDLCTSSHLSVSEGAKRPGRMYCQVYRAQFVSKGEG